MKVLKIFNKFQSQLKQQKLNKREANINKYIKIHDGNTYGNSFAQIYDARATIANYAKRNAVSIDIYDVKKLLEENESVSPIIENNFSDKLHLIVTNLLNGKSKSKIVSANTDKTYPKISEKQIIIPIHKDGIEKIGESINQTEDSFLRNLYRNIEYLTNSVTGKNSK